MLFKPKKIINKLINRCEIIHSNFIDSKLNIIITTDIYKYALLIINKYKYNILELQILIIHSCSILHKYIINKKENSNILLSLALIEQFLTIYN